VRLEKLRDDLHLGFGVVIDRQLEGRWEDAESGGMVVSGQRANSVQNLIEEIVRLEPLDELAIDSRSDAGQARRVDPRDLRGDLLRRLPQDLELRACKGVSRPGEC
jgi:hypothetical protein